MDVSFSFFIFSAPSNLKLTPTLRADPRRLRRVLGVWDASAYIICSIIGSGIFVSPKGVILRTGSSSTALAMWAATGAVNLVVAYCYAELALTFPETGEETFSF